jgi:hypothetical protein
MLDRAAAQLVQPSSRSHDDSAESGAAPEQHANLTASLNAPPVPERQEAMPCMIGDRMAEQTTTFPIDDSAESFEEASPAARSDVGLVAPLPAVPTPGTTSDAAVRVIGEGVEGQPVTFPFEDPAEAAESCAVASSPLVSDVPQRSLLDRLLDEAEALREVDVAAHDAASDLSDAASEPGVPAAQCPSAAGGRCQGGLLRDRAAAARKAFSRADALVAMAQGYLRGDRPERAPIEVVLTIPASSLRAGAPLDPVEVGGMGESFLSSETARRLSCDAGVVDVVEDEHGAPLTVGRRRRTIGGALKRALRKRDGMCGFPGCTNRIFLEGHHIQHWADGGETSLRNTTLLCSAHHRYVHEYG